MNNRYANNPSYKKVVDIWKRLDPLLQEERNRALIATDTMESLIRLKDAFESALFLVKPKMTSGLVEQQRLFQL
jgi:hypothetical protein